MKIKMSWFFVKKLNKNPQGGHSLQKYSINSVQDPQNHTLNTEMVVMKKDP